MVIDVRLFNLIKKKGFRDTFNVLAKFKDYRAEKNSFFTELNKFSYYNSYFRIKDDLLHFNLIKIGEKNGEQVNALTEKGLDVYNKLLELDEIISA